MQASLQSLVWESIVIWLVVLCISEILVSRSVGQWETKNFLGMALRDSYWYRCSLLSLAGILNDDSNNGGHSSTTSPRNISSMFHLKYFGGYNFVAVKLKGISKLRVRSVWITRSIVKLRNNNLETNMCGDQQLLTTAIQSKGALQHMRQDGRILFAKAFLSFPPNNLIWGNLWSNSWGMFWINIRLSKRSLFLLFCGAMCISKT